MSADPEDIVAAPRESLRMKPCPVCGRHVGAARLFELRGGLVCESCGRKEIERWNAMIANNTRVRS